MSEGKLSLNIAQRMVHNHILVMFVTFKSNMKEHSFLNGVSSTNLESILSEDRNECESISYTCRV